ncbi:MAG: DUF3037 domain-containing protein [Bacteroidia bacterium]|nr:DUF3037 domain-containing protein [Bacteroidia bacterium]
MQEKNLFEYAIVKIVPKVERGECLNVGVVLFCKKSKFLQAMFWFDEARILNAFPWADLDEIKQHLNAFEKICVGNNQAGTIASLDVQSRFKWLTAKRSTVIQTSKTHAGFCDNAETKLHQLFNQLVLV